ncbi:MAG TPA: DedA family protein [Dehalococcoidia bacterium]|nr:DedA family protein [Dehalococcoidia bacterium]
MEQIEHQILAFIGQVYNSMGWNGVVLLMAIESANIPVPSEIIMPFSGWLLIRDKGLGVDYVVVAGLYGALGCTIGSVVSYWVGAWGGRPLVERYGKYVLLSKKDLDTADKWFARWGDWAVFIARLLPVVRTFISFPAGISRMHFAKFTLLSFLGSFPWSLGLAYGGYVLGEHWEDLRRIMRPFDIPIIAAVLVLVGIYVYRRVSAESRESGSVESRESRVERHVE